MLAANHVINCKKMVSSEIGILSKLVKLPLLNQDPAIRGYGIWPCDTSAFSNEKFGGRSSGCGTSWDEALLGTVGETAERYASAFYNLDEATLSSYKKLQQKAIHPSEFALFHEEQHKHPNFLIIPFDENAEVNWFETTDLTNGGETVLCPGAFIYLPWTADKQWITLTTSTGLAAHTNIHKAMLTGMYELIERDSFTITWVQKLVPPKIVLSKDVKDYIHSIFPEHYEWHFFDITYDLKEPSVLGFCVGQADFGKFVAVGSSTRSTMAEALQKTAKEIGQGVGYFRHLMGEKKDWEPSDNFFEIMDFEQHSIFYTKRQDLWHVFDDYFAAQETRIVDMHEKCELSDADKLKRMFKTFKEKDYNVLFKDLTTPDIRQMGFYAVRMFVPQLIPMSGAYPFYFNGGKRLYEVPKLMGYTSNDYANLNPYPHPFP